MSDLLTPITPPAPTRTTRMRLVSFKPRRAGKLFGFASIELWPGLILYDLPVSTGRNGSPWASLGGRPVLGEDGRQVVHDGRKQFAPIGEWTSSALADQFSKRVIELIVEQYGSEVLR